MQWKITTSKIPRKMTKKYFETRQKRNQVILYCTHHPCSCPRPCTSWVCSTDIGSCLSAGCYTAGSWCMVGSWSFAGWTDGRIPERRTVITKQGIVVLCWIISTVRRCYIRDQSSSRIYYSQFYDVFMADPDLLRIFNLDSGESGACRAARLCTLYLYRK